MNNIISLLLALCLISSCSFNEEAAQTDVKLVKVETVKFTASNNINPYAINIEYYEKDSSKYLYILTGANQLLIYDFDKKECIKELSLETEGNNGVGKASGFKIITPDSIVITSQFYQKLFLINAEGIVIDHYSFKCDSLYTSYCISATRHPIFIEGNNLILPQNLVGNWNNLDPHYYSNYKTTINMNIATGKISKGALGLPFQQHELTNPAFSYCYLNGSFVYSFNASDSIYIQGPQGTVYSRFAGSPNVKNLDKKKMFNTNSIETIVKHEILSSEYEQIQSDPSLNIIYRFYRIGMESINTNQDLMEIHYYPPAFGIQILNETGDIIGDCIFPDNQYYYHNSFIAEGALYISNNHPMNKDFNVDYFSFTSFKPKFRDEK
ncbi:MAG: DUF4221 family protein [Draconibacterium sp.]